jgi:hypothetical protein
MLAEFLCNDVQGLPPGAYEFKYIVDGQWCIDMSWPTEIDMWGNSNNVIVVPGCAPAMDDAATEAADAADGMAASPAFDDGPPAIEMEPVLQPPPQRPGAPIPYVSPRERQSMARFGAAILALYTKQATVRRHVMR